MNVLVDRHHAGLYRSLQLLFENRLGAQLYTPIGADWREAGIWMFGGGGELGEALARQYLVPHEGIWEPIYKGHELAEYSHTDAEFPLCPIFGMPLERAAKEPWDYVVATVSDNQYGFKQFADAVGAQYVYHVGNTNQYIDWRLDPLAIVASEMPILGRGVRVHEELDWQVRRRVPPTIGGSIISSFVNCFPQMATWSLWLEMQREWLPDWTFNCYGIDGPQDVVKPIGLLQQKMAGSKWGWHDKEHGDGFGHVLHMWAAIGRPIIGHGSHYAGKMGSVFWEHGRTCIDLDYVSMPEAARMIREISADHVRYSEMCASIRATYELIDWDLEERQIRELLGIAVPEPV